MREPDAQPDATTPDGARMGGADCGEFDGDLVGSGTITGNDMAGVFYCGDNLEVLNELRHVSDESVDLVYLDPPFNSRRTFNIVYKGSLAQTEAFKDFWSWEEAARGFEAFVEASSTPPRLRLMLRALREALIEEDADLLAYLAMMAPRLVALRRVLKPSGALWLHCDATASHYLKVVLDSIFGSGLFKNELIWQRTTGKALQSKRLPNNHDVLLLYRGDEGTWNLEATFSRYDLDNLDEKTAKKYSHRDADGRRYQLDNLINPNPDRPNLTYEFLGVTRVWRWTRERMQAAYEAGVVVQPRPGAVPRFKRYLDEQNGRPFGDVWTDIPPLNSQASERLGYPTQKPLALLERIIRIGTNEGDLVLDPFCGCGTTIEACERWGRRWIGIDIAAKAVEVIEGRFAALGLDAPEVIWAPPDLDAAAALAKRSGIKFEEWARRKVRAVKRRKKDRGIDGEAFFRDAAGRVTHVLVSVKSGKLTPAMVRELRGTVERERAPIGVLVTMQEPSKEMRREATEAGFLDGHIPKLQILTMAQVFAGEGIRAPGVNVTEMPSPSVPTGTPNNQEQLGLKWGPTSLKKPSDKSKPSKPPEATKASATKKRQAG